MDNKKYYLNLCKSEFSKEIESTSDYLYIYPSPKLLYPYCSIVQCNDIAQLYEEIYDNPALWVIANIVCRVITDDRDPAIPTLKQTSIVNIIQLCRYEWKNICKLDINRTVLIDLMRNAIKAWMRHKKIVK